jgi:macrolide-specific efflux system membrane fusion protein
MFVRCCFVLFVLALGASGAKAASVEARSVLVKLIEQVDVPAEEAGRLASIDVREGQSVRQGDRLAQIEDAAARLALQRAELELAIAIREAEDTADVRSAQQALEFARAELQRARESVKKFRNSISQSELDRMELAEVQADSELASAQKDLSIARTTCELRRKQVDMANLQVRRRQITSPLDGVVVEVLQNTGEWVEAGAKVVRLIRLDMLRAEGFVQLKDMVEPLVGRDVQLWVVVPGRGETEFAGKVVFVHPEIDPVNQQVRIWADIPNPDRQLLPGMVARMVVGSR